MNNLLSYCGLVDARISASEKDLPVNKYLDFGRMTTIARKMPFQIYPSFEKNKQTINAHS